MIVVTGFTRSGTSLMMRICMQLGLRTPCPKFNPNVQQVTEMNQEGFYEFPSELVDNGLNTRQFQGQVVKLFHAALHNTHPKYVSKLIIMKRDKQQALDSSLRMFDKLKFPYPPDRLAALYDECYRIIGNYSTFVPEITINLHGLVSNPEQHIQTVNDHIGGNGWISEAAALVRRL